MMLYIYMYTMTFFHAIHNGEKLIFLASIMLGLNIHIWATSKKMKQKCDIEGQISNQIDHNKFSIF